MTVKKILVAEDEKALARTLKLKLENAGYFVTAVYNGDEVFRELDAGRFDLLVLDLVMPGLDGFGVLARLKQRGVKMPVVVLSNLSQAEDIQRVVSLGTGHYLIKSETAIKDVVAQIGQILA
jgi:two-component system alkaline phosphatase synthesis response regulator PhoP